MTDVALKCGKCGSKQLQVEADPKDDSVVTCGGCGAVGTYGDVMRQGKAEIMKAMQRELSNMFKR
ncbi:hypothetical protein A3710_17250 [Stutzerimonas frequens]|uniref:ECs_2282 family putative zinc-binding protein n=1 Tax=Stutzerimonas frequens TaxID=2968969 RepID=UPI0007B78D4B|nr:hypothetical protein A3710_17250 [Stutzerimonas frequens]